MQGIRRVTTWDAAFQGSNVLDRPRKCEARRAGDPLHHTLLVLKLLKQHYSSSTCANTQDMDPAFPSDLYDVGWGAPGFLVNYQLVLVLFILNYAVRLRGPPQQPELTWIPSKAHKTRLSRLRQQSATGWRGYVGLRGWCSWTAAPHSRVDHSGSHSCENLSASLHPDSVKGI